MSTHVETLVAKARRSLYEDDSEKVQVQKLTKTLRKEDQLRRLADEAFRNLPRPPDMPPPTLPIDENPHVASEPSRHPNKRADADDAFVNVPKALELSLPTSTKDVKPLKKVTSKHSYRPSVR